MSTHALFQPIHAAQPGDRQLTLERLVAMDSSELERHFAAARADDLTPVDGAPQARLLAIRGLERPRLARWRRWFAASRLNLWQGKSFAVGPGPSAGANRVRLGGGGRALFPFAVAVAPSIVDGEACIAIDYDVPANPRVARRVYDELRLVAPGLYLGRGTVRWRGERRPVLWFAVDTTRYDKPLALPPLG